MVKTTNARMLIPTDNFKYGSFGHATEAFRDDTEDHGIVGLKSSGMHCPRLQESGVRIFNPEREENLREGSHDERAHACSSNPSRADRAAVASNGVLLPQRQGMTTRLSDGDPVAFVKAAAA